MEPEVWRGMGLSDSEFERIKELLGREPNYVELGMFAVMWSEHCSYKSSRRVLKMFPTTSPHVIQGPGENAGIVDIGDGQAVVFKMESHNHPSAIEPFQGAATGVGGIVRDIFTMGARPIALLDSLRFGDLSKPRVKYLLNGVVGGIAWYGNCIGVPTVGGEIYFEDKYEGNPLVNVMCVGLIDHRRVSRGAARGVGNPVMIVGARTGRDGIHGATFASEELGEESLSRRPSVQVGDPFMEKLLIEACLEVIGTGWVVGMQDMGAAGITSSCVEMASRAGLGMEIDLDVVPRRETGMTPYELMLSESQERMLVVVEKGREEEVQKIFQKWGLEAVVMGRVTADGILRVKEGGRVVAQVPVKLLTDEAPVYDPPRTKPGYIDELARFDPGELPSPQDLNGALLQILSSPSMGDKSWIFSQYDHMVQTNTVYLPGRGAALLRIKNTNKGIALTTDGNGRYCYLDPFRGGAIAVAEAARNLVCTGARPLGITDCLNWGNPEKPEVFWTFVEAVRGMSAACRELGIPVVSGNVSFYNETSGEAVFPTPVVGMVGLLADIERRVKPGFGHEGDVVVLLGETKPELGGSEYLKVVHRKIAGRVPEINLAREKALHELCLAAAKLNLLSSAQDLSEGGLAVALAECCIWGNVGAELDIESELRPHEFLFSESQSRVLVCVGEDDWKKVQELSRKYAVPATVLGRVQGSRLIIRYGNKKVIDLEVEEMKRKWEEAIPCLME